MPQLPRVGLLSHPHPPIQLARGRPVGSVTGEKHIPGREWQCGFPQRGEIWICRRATFLASEILFNIITTARQGRATFPGRISSSPVSSIGALQNTTASMAWTTRVNSQIHCFRLWEGRCMPGYSRCSHGVDIRRKSVPTKRSGRISLNSISLYRRSVRAR